MGRARDVLIVVALATPLAGLALWSIVGARPANEPSVDVPVPPATAAGKEQIYIAHARTAEGDKYYFTMLPPAVFQEQGLARECIVGTSQRPILANKHFSPENFARNPLFTRLMHEVIAQEGPKLAAIQQEAREVGDGPVIVYDLRSAHLYKAGLPPPEDIIGVFQAKGGALEPDSYQRGLKHVLLSPDGFFRLEPELHKKLLERLLAVNQDRQKHVSKPEPAKPQKSAPPDAPASP